MSARFAITPPRLEDTAQLGRLLLRSDDGILHLLFNNKEYIATDAVRDSNGLFSFRHMSIIRSGSLVVGMVLAMNPEQAEGRTWPTFKFLLREVGLWYLLRHSITLVRYARCAQIFDDECRLYNIAVRERFGEAGMGTELVRHVARSTDKIYIVLDVAMSNTPALRFYRGLGFIDRSHWKVGGVRYARLYIERVRLLQ